MEYKDTLNMPKSGFEMRGKLPTKEPEIQKYWQDSKLYERMLERREGCEEWVLHDGPPYANGDIHIGHALNKILKDVIVRNHYMLGYKTPFIPGWDTHGLPIETAITKLGNDRKKMPLSKFRNLCYDYALKQVANQKAGFLSLGCIGDYDHPYITLNKEYEANQIDVFGKMAMQGLIYKGKKPVYWSPSSESALAEAEIEYHDIKSPAIFVKFDVKDGKGILTDEDSFVIWTTTPWTIPANLAICVNPDFEYALVKSEKGNLVVLNSMVDDLWEQLGLEEKTILKTFKGKDLEMITCKHPLLDKESLVILGDHVSDDAGSGCVHTAPGFGADDFMVSQKYGLEIYCNVNEQGYLMEGSGANLDGLYYEDANKEVTKQLEENGHLLKLSFITHAYPHDWRTKKPIIFRATTQWFASIDKIREALLKEIHDVKWIPSWGEQRMHNMIQDRGDWCISRQRAWGVPIPIFYTEDNMPIMDEVIFKHISDLFREYGSNIWFEKEANELLPEGYTNPASPNGIFRKEMDTMDVWFDSGSSNTGVLKERGLNYPADLYFEGSDQYRGWFNSSLIIGTAIHKQAPYKSVLSHGFVMDEKGEKMSKSLGNAVSPKEINQKYGADILRLWATSVDYQADCRIGDNIVKQAAESYRKVRNTFKFILGNISKENFDLSKYISYDNLSNLNKYILIELNELVKTVKKAYLAYDFPQVTSTLINFMTNTLSAYYFDYTKDILYIEDPLANERLQVLSVLYSVCDTLLKLWSPILVHTCEEVNHFYGRYNESIHLQDFPEIKDYEDADIIRKQVNRALLIRKDVFKAMEESRNKKVIKKTLEAEVLLNVEKADQELLETLLKDQLATWFTVSKVVFTDQELTKYDNSEVEIRKCAGVVCPRCWKVTQSTRDDGLCDHCHDVLNK